MSAANPNDPRTARLKFREILARPGVTVMPGGFSPLYARMCEEIGFECFFVAGSQMSGFLLGVPDNGIIGLRDVVDHVRHIAARTTIPIFVDADTGFGNAVNVHYTVGELIRSGVAGMQIEDQESPKKSGTVAGRRCIPLDEAVGKIRAAVAARDEIDPTFVICARCDELGAEGGTFASTLERCIAYVRDGGADLVWLNSVQTRADLRAVCEGVPGPVLAIWGGSEERAPTIEEYGGLGVRIALYPTLAATSGLQGSFELLSDFHARGTQALSDYAKRVDANPYGRVDRRKLIADEKVRELEQFLPDAQKRDYETTWGHQPFSEKR
jgi:2-methylisocitrate lyase-like PEP mutase family enzyme